MKNELLNVERISRTPVWLRVDENKGWPDWLSPLKRWSFTQPSKWGGPQSFPQPPSALSHRPRRMPKGQVGDCLPPVRVTLSKVHKWKTIISSPLHSLPLIQSRLNFDPICELETMSRELTGLTCFAFWGWSSDLEARFHPVFFLAHGTALQAEAVHFTKSVGFRVSEKPSSTVRRSHFCTAEPQNWLANP